ncbi:VanZ family protein [Curtobacterium sp. VKM Ac-1376]|uniref:VanZ family protein n=1 Tax=Curtobacterium sp. VKM Ac-1376 TaxID=123312 RepID=UPI002B26B4AF|nr:VanZ family protein [Curtobacterium sp. VKM Ac-1376]
MPVLPVVIPLGGVIFTVLVAVLHVRRRSTLPRIAVALALSVYASGIAANTVFPIFLDPPPNEGPWIPPLNVVPVVGYEWRDAVTNMLVFLPLGLLVPLLLARPSWWRVVPTVAGVSLVIEATQFVTAGLAAGGHIADVNDWVCNTVGGAAGYGVFVLLARAPATADLVDRFRWSGRPRP